MLDIKFFFTLISGLVVLSACSQESMEGSFKESPNTNLKLIGYSGFETYLIDEDITNSKGEFSFKYSSDDFGCAYILNEDNQSYIVILNSTEKLIIRGSRISNPNTIKILRGIENKLFDQYSIEHKKREQTLLIWDNLIKTYSGDSLFIKHNNLIPLMQKEKTRIRSEDSLFLSSLPENSFIEYYLPLRRLITSAYTSVQFKPEMIPQILSTFRQVDHKSKHLYKSGLLKEVIETHFWLIENSGFGRARISNEMKKSVDFLILDLIGDTEKLNLIFKHLFHYFEERSLFDFSDYLAKSLLSSNRNILDVQLLFELEAYVTMQKGKIAPDIKFHGDLILPPGIDEKNMPKSLLDLNHSKKLLFFGSSNCGQCADELKKLTKFYDYVKGSDIEVIFISLDTVKEDFLNTSSTLPFFSFCDYKGNQGQAIIDYHVFASPTIFLLSDDNEILLKPNSIDHLNAWISS